MRICSAASFLTFAIWSIVAAGCGGTPTHETVAKESIGVMEEFNSALDAVKDEASAKAAAPKIDAIVIRMNALKAKMESMGKPSPEVQAQMEKGPEAGRMAKAIENMTKNMMRIGSDPKLIAPLQTVMEKMK